MQYLWGSTTKDVKWCAQCGEGTVKPERESCKRCDCKAWLSAEDKAAFMSSDDLSAHKRKAKAMSGISHAQLGHTVKFHYQAKLASHSKSDMEGMEGKDLPNDVHVVGQEQAMAALVDMVEAATTAETAQQWALRGLHLGVGAAEGKSTGDVFAAFLRWAQKDADRDKDSYNVIAWA